LLGTAAAAHVMIEHPAVAAQAAPGLILPGGDLIANADFRAR